MFTFGGTVAEGDGPGGKIVVVPFRSISVLYSHHRGDTDVYGHETSNGRCVDGAFAISTSTDFDIHEIHELPGINIDKNN